MLGLRPDRLAWLPVPILLVIIGVLWATDSRTSHESPFVMMALNVVFSLLASVFVAYLVSRSFLVRGTLGLLLLGCGIVFWGAGALVGTVAGLTGAAHDFPNAVVSIHNTCVGLSSLCQLAGAVFLLRPQRTLHAPGLWLAGGYGAALGVVGLITFSVLTGRLPIFFVQGQGGTPLRWLVLGSAVIMFALAAALFRVMNRKAFSSFAYWYSLALALIATGVFGIMIERVHGGMLSWMARATQFLSGVYMLIAAVASVRETGAWGIPLDAAPWERRLTVWDDRLLRLLTPKGLWSLPSLLRYTLAVVLVVAATALRAALIPWIGTTAPYNVSLVLLLVTTVLLGTGPGLLFVLLGDLGVEVFVLGSAPRASEGVALLRLVTTGATGVFLCCILHGVRVAALKSHQSEARLREVNATLETKVAERTAQLEDRARQLQRLTLELSQTEDRERRRMAEILHDDLQQIIAGAKFHLNAIRNRVKHDASVGAVVSEVDQMLKEAIEKSRSLSHELSPAVLQEGDFTETLRWLADQMQARHGLVVHVHATGRGELRSDAILTFLYRTVQELLFNVVKHARVKEATIRMRRHGSCVCLSVSDRGRGFDPQGLRQAGGYGLLSIRERIELLGGRMKIRSLPGLGSTFFLVVPDGSAPEDRGRTADSVAVLRPPSSVVRVLLADDHRIVRESLRLLLRDEPDIEIVGEAVHGREAVDLALRLEPDVVIMDVSMPLIDGDLATRRIRERLPKTRVVALSTYNEPETIQKMYQAGAESYVLKTASSDELLAAIRGEQPADDRV